MVRDSPNHRLYYLPFAVSAFSFAVTTLAIGHRRPGMRALQYATTVELTFDREFRLFVGLEIDVYLCLG